MWTWLEHFAVLAHRLCVTAFARVRGLTFWLRGRGQLAEVHSSAGLGLSMPSLNGSAIAGRQTSWKRIYGKNAKFYMFVAQPWLKRTLQLAAVGDDEDVLARDNFEQVAVNELFGKYFDTKFFFELSLNTDADRKTRLIHPVRVDTSCC